MYRFLKLFKPFAGRPIQCGVGTLQGGNRLINSVQTDSHFVFLFFFLIENFTENMFKNDEK